ncbi:MAG: tryptophan synthase subunit alpha [Actinomycetes bacterium]
MSAVSDAFATADRALLVGYLPAGFPSVDAASDALVAMVSAGVDVVEVGLPYSDPVLDGPTIATAVEHALRAGTGVDEVLATVGAVAATGAPSLVMTYWNPVERRGPARFAAELAAAGGTGVILPDLPVEESDDWLAAAGREGLDTVFVVAPSSTDERLRRVTDRCAGFVYASAVMGVTGARDQVGRAAADLVARVRGVSSLPVGVGLGVSTPAQAEQVAEFADAVIVGSAFVRRLLDAADIDAGVTAVAELAGDLATGVRAAGRRAGVPAGPGR